MTTYALIGAAGYIAPRHMRAMADTGGILKLRLHPAKIWHFCHCFIGAGAVVTKDVPAFALMAGNPARRIGWMSRAGERLGSDLVCRRTHRRYELRSEALVEIEV